MLFINLSLFVKNFCVRTTACSHQSLNVPSQCSYQPVAVGAAQPDSVVQIVLVSTHAVVYGTSEVSVHTETEGTAVTTGTLVVSVQTDEVVTS